MRVAVYESCYNIIPIVICQSYDSDLDVLLEAVLSSAVVKLGSAVMAERISCSRLIGALIATHIIHCKKTPSISRSVSPLITGSCMSNLKDAIEWISTLIGSDPTSPTLRAGLMDCLCVAVTLVVSKRHNPDVDVAMTIFDGVLSIGSSRGKDVLSVSIQHFVTHVLHLWSESSLMSFIDGLVLRIVSCEDMYVVTNYLCAICHLIHLLTFRGIGWDIYDARDAPQSPETAPAPHITLGPPGDPTGCIGSLYGLIRSFISKPIDDTTLLWMCRIATCLPVQTKHKLAGQCFERIVEYSRTLSNKLSVSQQGNKDPKVEAAMFYSSQLLVNYSCLYQSLKCTSYIIDNVREFCVFM